MTSELLNHRYRIVQALGSGGFGETFLAEDTHLPSGRPCVVKQLKPIAQNPEIDRLVQERFHREAAVLEQLGTAIDQIPQLLAYFQEENRFYLVQEWVAGISLKDYLRQQGTLAEREARELLVSLLKVLHQVHSHGIIHRDIKPSNIMVRQQDGKPILIDFGAAKEVMTLIDAGTPAQSIAIGTPGFMPPEQMGGHPVFASDLYSLALTIIHALSGKLPYELPRHSGTGLLDWQQLPPISSEFAIVLQQAIQYSCHDRYPSAQTMLETLLAESVVPQPVHPPVDQTLTLPTPSCPLPHSGAPPPIPVSSPVPSLPAPPLTRQEYLNRQILLNKVRNYWIKGVLETSLQGRVAIELNLCQRSDALERPWNALWEPLDQARQSLPPGIRLIHKFEALGAGRTLLILGEPGGGKTTTLLELARDLLVRAEQDPGNPLPIVFNLSSWGGPEGQKKLGTIADWLVEELHTKYQVSPEIARSWIQDEQLLLLLDGLDEVHSRCRNACVQALNEFSKTHGHTEMVVCSRIQDYEALSHRLRFQAAVYLQSLSFEQIQQYLLSAGPELDPVRTLLQADPALQELARSPLMLNMMSLAYRGMDISQFPQASLEERRYQLFDAYLDRMVQRRPLGIYTRTQYLEWLRWLAQNLQRTAETVFLIERMQPGWLPTRFHRWLYAIGIGVFAGLSCGLASDIVGYLILGWEAGLIYGLIFGLAGGILVALVFGILNHEIYPVETLKWSWEKARDSLVPGIGVGFVSGPLIMISMWLVYGLLFELGERLIYSLLYGVLSGVGVGIIFVLLRGLRGPSIGMSHTPNQGIWQSARNAAAFALIGVVGLSVVAAMVNVSLVIGVASGLIFGVFGAGEACVQHFVLRVILYWAGRIPWNYARFLDDAVDRILMQRVGGGYIFIHRLLLDHLAALPLDQKPHRFS